MGTDLLLEPGCHLRNCSFLGLLGLVPVSAPEVSTWLTPWYINFPIRWLIWNKHNHGILYEKELMFFRRTCLTLISEREDSSSCVCLVSVPRCSLRRLHLPESHDLSQTVCWGVTHSHTHTHTEHTRFLCYRVWLHVRTFTKSCLLLRLFGTFTQALWVSTISRYLCICIFSFYSTCYLFLPPSMCFSLHICWEICLNFLLHKRKAKPDAHFIAKSRMTPEHKTIVWLFNIPQPQVSACSGLITPTLLGRPSNRLRNLTAGIVSSQQHKH